MCASTFSQLCREWDSAQQHAEAVINLGMEHELTLLLAQGTLLHGRVLVEIGQTSEGIQQLEQGLASYLATGAEVWRPMYLSMLGAAYERSGLAGEGLDRVTQALEIVETSQERWWEPELYRLRGSLLVDMSSDNGSEAELCYRKAIESAQSQQAKSWELHAVTSLARLWQSQGKHQKAYDLLAPIYNWFTEGFDTADLKDAKALVAQLAQGE